MQEAVLEKPLPPCDAKRYMPPVVNAAPADLIKQAAEWLKHAKHPVILAGRVSRDVTAWKQRVALAEAIGARVTTSLKVGAAFPTDHPLHVDAPMNFTKDELTPLLKEADVILSLDWVDLAGTLKPLGGPPAGKVIQVSLDHQLHNGWSMDYQAPAAGRSLHLGRPGRRPPPRCSQAIGPVPAKTAGGSPRPLHEPKTRRARARRRGPRRMRCAAPSASATSPSPICRCPGRARSGISAIPLDFVGSDGGGGVGGGPGISVGVALALKGSGRLPIGICGDGDFLMSVTSLWTAVHYRIPLLIVVANNRSFYNDEVHQERMAIMRNRPVENKWIGQKMLDPEIDLAALARAQGAHGFGPISKAEELPKVFAEAIAAVDAGGVAVVDVRIEPGYGARDSQRRHGAQDGVTALNSRGSWRPCRHFRNGQPRACAARSRASSSSTTSSCSSRRRKARWSRSTMSRSSVRPGEFLAVIGPSGCGKSTLFNVVGGLLDSYDGAVTVAGETVRGPHPAIGMVFQEESTFPWRTVIENVAFPLEIAGIGEGRAARQGEALHLAGRPHRIREPLSQRALRRHAPARRHRPHARLRAEDPADGRAVRLARRADPAAARRQGAADPAGPQADDAAHHPQHHRGRAARPTASW